MTNNKISFSKFVNGVYYDLGEPSNYSTARLSAWFLDNANVGKLNNLIGTCASGVGVLDENCNLIGYNLDPFPSNDQLAIYKMLFDYEFFKTEARVAASSSMTVGDDWTNLKEGDSSITRINKNEVSKNYRNLARDAKEDLDKAVKMYLKYNAIPDQVAGDDTAGVSTYRIQDYTRTLSY